MSEISAKLRAKCVIVCAVLCLGTNANAREGLRPLVGVWVTSKPLQVVQACAIRALDAAQRTYSRISPDVKHVAKIRVPNRIVQIQPADRNAVADTDHLLKLEKI